MIGTIRVKVGRSSMVIKGKDASEIESDLRRVYEPMLAAGEKLADAVHAKMLTTWPIFTGRTRLSFHPVIIMDTARYRAEVGYRSDDPNVWYVRSSKLGRKRGATDERWALQSDLQTPMKAERKQFAVEAAKVLADSLRRSFNG